MPNLGAWVQDVRLLAGFGIAMPDEYIEFNILTRKIKSNTNKPMGDVKPMAFDSVADMLITLREKAGQSQAEFAKMLGISIPRLSAYEKRQGLPRTGALIHRMAKALKVSRDHLEDLIKRDRAKERS